MKGWAAQIRQEIERSDAREKETEAADRGIYPTRDGNGLITRMKMMLVRYTTSFFLIIIVNGLQCKKNLNM